MPFGTRPGSGPISLRNCRDVVIEDRTFRDLGENVIAIRLERCRSVTIRAVDFIGVAQGVYAQDSTDIVVEWARYSNITGPHERVGLSRGNFVQFDGVQHGRIAHSKGKGGDTEDIVSVFESSDIVVEDNHFEGTDWQSNSGSGIALGDGGGRGNVAINNTLMNPGQVCLFIGGGTKHRIERNTCYGEQRPLSNVGIYVWNQARAECSGHTIANNRVQWRQADGAANPFWNAGNCGPVIQSGNDLDALIDTVKLTVDL